MDQKGLYAKYTITKNSDGSEVKDAFVLKPETDRHARIAMLDYARSVENDDPQLADELREWVWHVSKGKPVGIDELEEAPLDRLETITKGGLSEESLDMLFKEAQTFPMSIQILIEAIKSMRKELQHGGR